MENPVSPASKQHAQKKSCTSLKSGEPVVCRYLQGNHRARDCAVVQNFVHPAVFLLEQRALASLVDLLFKGTSLTGFVVFVLTISSVRNKNGACQFKGHFPPGLLIFLLAKQKPPSPTHPNQATPAARSNHLPAALLLQFQGSHPKPQAQSPNQPGVPLKLINLLVVPIETAFRRFLKGKLLNGEVLTKESKKFGIPHLSSCSSKCHVLMWKLCKRSKRWLVNNKTTCPGQTYLSMSSPVYGKKLFCPKDSVHQTAAKQPTCQEELDFLF